MQDKPKMYQNKFGKEFHNNETVYATYCEKEGHNGGYNIVNDSNIIRKKIDSIVNANNFIYSKMVNIVIGNDVIKRKIIGIYNNNLVTIDNEYIPLDNIKDIYI